MKRGNRAERLVAAVRAVPRNLREDLWTTAGDDPLASTARRPRWLDWRPAIVVPLALAAVVLLAADANRYAFLYGMGLPYGILVAALQAAAPVAALYRPVPAWWVSTGAMVLVAYHAAGHIEPFTQLPWYQTGLPLQAAVLFLAALRVRPRTAVEMLVIDVLTGLFTDAVISDRFNDARFPVAVLALSVVVGTALRGRQVARTELVAQEELTAGERARRTVLEERSRIARELHDVVAHHMSVISIQAQVAPHLADNPSDELKENLRGIRQNAVEALAELRRVLDVLRSEDALSDSARHAPQPTLDRLGELVGKVRGAGLDVSVETAGEPRPLSPGAELSAFRIVQEALSNAMRHAPGAAVRVEVGYRRHDLTLRVTNTAPDGPAPPSAGTGHGLLGMRERATMLGGELATGPTPDGGYEVTAILPARPPHPPADPAEDTP
ncbi:sensor histidine kinase [Streptomyces sp. GS7]|uniref:sensor histidine kinase n=1 Tax=Streptomyces sp. GS7 TaxID=2692234 RepID=UPI001F332569|nr:sensor histidine kinase [Streptomyces sp. GS7]